MKSILLKLKDEEFWKLLKIKNNFSSANRRNMTWEEFILTMTIQKEVRARKW